MAAVITANLPLSAIASVYAYAIVGSCLLKFGAPDLAGFTATTAAQEGVFRFAFVLNDDF